MEICDSDCTIYVTLHRLLRGCYACATFINKRWSCAAGCQNMHEMIAWIGRTNCVIYLMPCGRAWCCNEILWILGYCMFFNCSVCSASLCSTHFQAGDHLSARCFCAHKCCLFCCGPFNKLEKCLRLWLTGGGMNRLQYVVRRASHVSHALTDWYVVACVYVSTGFSSAHMHVAFTCLRMLICSD